VLSTLARNDALRQTVESTYHQTPANAADHAAGGMGRPGSQRGRYDERNDDIANGVGQANARAGPIDAAEPTCRTGERQRHVRDDARCRPVPFVSDRAARTIGSPFWRQIRPATASE